MQYSRGLQQHSVAEGARIAALEARISTDSLSCRNEMQMVSCMSVCHVLGQRQRFLAFPLRRLLSATTAPAGQTAPLNTAGIEVAEWSRRSRFKLL